MQIIAVDLQVDLLPTLYHHTPMTTFGVVKIFKKRRIIGIMMSIHSMLPPPLLGGQLSTSPSFANVELIIIVENHGTEQDFDLCPRYLGNGGRHHAPLSRLPASPEHLSRAPRRLPGRSAAACVKRRRSVGVACDVV